jgi:hypothetical protein
MKVFLTRAFALCFVGLLTIGSYSITQSTQASSLPSANNSLNSTIIYDYKTVLAVASDSGDANSIRLTYDPITQKLLVAVFENGDAVGYLAENISNPIDSFTMQKVKVFDDNNGSFSPLSTIVVEVTSIDTSEIVFNIIYSPKYRSTYAAPKVEETPQSLRPGMCSNASGTGACDNVIDDSAWWRCFRCCLIFSCG